MPRARRIDTSRQARVDVAGSLVIREVQNDRYAKDANIAYLLGDLMVGGAQAQDNPLVGDWLSTHMDRAAERTTRVYRFQADVRPSTATGVGFRRQRNFTIIWQYHLTGPNATPPASSIGAEASLRPGMCLPNTPRSPSGRFRLHFESRMAPS